MLTMNDAKPFYTIIRHHGQLWGHDGTYKGLVDVSESPPIVWLEAGQTADAEQVLVAMAEAMIERAGESAE